MTVKQSPLESCRVISTILKDAGWFDPQTKISSVIEQLGPVQAMRIAIHMDTYVRDLNEILPHDEQIPMPRVSYVHAVRREKRFHEVEMMLESVDDLEINLTEAS